MKPLANSSGFIEDAISRLPDPLRKPRNDSDKNNLACVSRYLVSMIEVRDRGASALLAAKQSRYLLVQLSPEELTAIELSALRVLLDGVEMISQWQGEAGKALEAFLSAFIQITEKRNRKLSKKELLNLFADHATPMLSELCSFGLWTDESLQRSLVKSSFANPIQIEKDLKLNARILSSTEANSAVDRMIPVLDFLKWGSPTRQ
jgi:hypothetical protein